MPSFPLASPLYPTRYSTALEGSGLREVSQSNFRTHASILAERLHRTSETILWPARLHVQLLAHIIEPLPGAGKENRLQGIAIRVSSLALSILLTPVALLSTALALPFRSIAHRYRPAISYLDNSSSKKAKGKRSEELLLTKENPLSIRTHNVGFVTSSMSTAGDLRPPTERAKELVKSILEDSKKPDVIFFQETFHEDATRILANGIKEEYPYIVHSVAPHISGFSSGALVASKYPIEGVKFQRLGHMSGPETLSPRGIIRIRLNSSQGPLLLYGAHTQALIGETRAKARFKQLEEMKELMDLDAKKEPGIPQVLMGDFNTSRITAWGEDNLEPKGQAEAEVMERLGEYFEDPYLADHDPLTGERTKGKPFYLQKDNERLGEDPVEPSGSWYQGPFDKKGLILSEKMKRDRRKYGRPDPKKIIPLEKSTWGTRHWHSHQTAKTARFDYILFPKKNKLKAKVEIRRVIVPKGAKSASSDHLPVDGRIWISAKKT